MLRINKLLVLLLLTFLTTFTVIACNGSQSGNEGAVRVGSKDFTEQYILGEMYALMLENQGLLVERKLNLGGTPVAQAGLLKGEIDLYPEYTGTGLLTVLKLPSSSNQEKVYKTVAKEYGEKFNLEWLEPSPMNNTQALVMTTEAAKQQEIQTISDLVNQASEITMIGPPEFQARADGLPGLKKVYADFTLKEYKAVDAGLRYQGLINGDADVAVGFSTDGEIKAFNLLILEDDKNLFPPYQVAPVVRQEVLENKPGVRNALNSLSPKLTNEIMQTLNNEVTGKKREPAEVAKEFLQQQGLLKDS